MDDTTCAPHETPCQSAPEEWYPDRGDEAMAARTLCRHCPVIRECLEYALKLERGRKRQHRHGIWGGLTPAQRDRLDRAA